MKKQKHITISVIATTCAAIAVGLLGDHTRPKPNLENLEKPSIHRAIPQVVDPDNWKSLARVITRESGGFHGSVGYIVKDLDSGDIVDANAHKVFRSASLIKLPVMVVAFQAAEEGRLSLSTLVTLRKSDRRGGSGLLKFAPEGSVYTIRELIEQMIVHSDNTAAELITQRLGFGYMRTTFAALGLMDTEIYPTGFNLSSRRVAEDNMTSPRDMAYVLEKIYRRELVSAAASDEMLTILKHQKMRDRLPKYLPQGWEIAHKTGLLRKACHDVGIVFSPSGNYMICVMTSDQATYKTAKRFIASLGRITFDYYRYGTADPHAHHVTEASSHAG